MKKVILALLVSMTTFVTIANDRNAYQKEEKQSEETITDEHPKATISDKEGKYTISVGGNINMRIGYDFGGISDHPDFVTALIPMADESNAQRKFYLDATTSRVEVKGRAHTEKYGDIELCLNADFKGGSTGSYTPRVRLAYITIRDFVIGRNFTTFCDMGAAAPNIDFQGPSVCPYIYTTQIRYSHSFLNDKFIIGAAIESGGYESSTLGDTFDYQEQYLPAVPAYMQFNWGKEYSSHIRLTGLYKSIPLYDIANEQDVNLNGWGAQLSGSISAGRYLKFYYSGTCGEGITDYMQDTYGSGLDVVVNNGNPTITQMYGWQASVLSQITSRTVVSAGYSAVNICGDSSHFDSNDYRQGEYIFANMFYSLTSRIQLATEFLWGSRTNMDGQYSSANRVNAMVQYNF